MKRSLLSCVFMLFCCVALVLTGCPLMGVCNAINVDVSTQRTVDKVYYSELFAGLEQEIK